MGIKGFNFSLQGLSHKIDSRPCQDNSAIFQKGNWELAVVADGVGNCKHSDIASKIAVDTVCKVVNAGFPYDGDDNFLSLMRIAMHSAENAIEAYVRRNDGDISNYHTTLTIALFNGVDLFYGHAGDSGIIALDEYGRYRILTSKHNNEYGEVHTLSERSFEVGKAGFRAAAVLCMTDGLLDWIVPASLNKHVFPVHVPRASILANPSLWEIEDDGGQESFEEYAQSVEESILSLVGLIDDKQEDHPQYGDLREGNLKDDLSAAVLINYDSLIEPDSIKWEPPPEPTIEDIILKDWQTMNALYPSRARDEFLKKLSQNNPTWDEEQVKTFADTIWKLDSPNGPQSKNGSEPQCESISGQEQFQVDVVDNSASDNRALDTEQLITEIPRTAPQIIYLGDGTGSASRNTDDDHYIRLQNKSNQAKKRFFDFFKGNR